MSTGVVLFAPPEAPNYVDAIVEQAREAAAAGLRSAWFGQRFDYDSPGLAAIVGREVPQLRVGSSAIPIFGRHPLLVSSQAQTTQAATHGRYDLGLALGAPAFMEATFGLPYDRPIGLLREFLTVVRSLVETGSADFHGERLSTTTLMSAKVPGAEPTVPVLVAAMGPQALRVTGELADGTIPYLAGPKTLDEHIVPTITSAAQKAGRPAPRVVTLLPVVVTSDVDRVRENAERQLAMYDQLPSYHRVVGLEGKDRAAELAVIGDEETVAAAIRRYRAAGATEIVATETDLGGPADQRRTWRLLGELAND
ncbi:TIGR03564 family F420-dependent LLM class oxidoreductase [Streptomyces sp. SL13]|uniref:TIGR03564 family F420-dependent LLM class oxidoreductase n=1 Tax=Streptantibioticus silvisoli TaxID=2705255 RepID=A0AA90K113_9ACTN|nr:TIGR03564 family F420-dependent LLM class oxidoreductase [Streptantibioticus silvisoli]MDI5973481.1 TIGR03564 family F420-dependent LLM class oxidoreductase [Streptantibioticus silvisoli]